MKFPSRRIFLGLGLVLAGSHPAFLASVKFLSDPLVTRLCAADLAARGHVEL